MISYFKSLLTCITVCIIATVSCAQTDSLTVANTKWQEKKIARGITLKQYWFEHSLFSSNQNISILAVKMNRRNRLDVVGDSRTLKPTSTFAGDYNAVAAVNGTFFDMKHGGSVDYVRIDGRELDSTRTGKNRSRSFHQRSAIVIDGKKVSVHKWNGAPNWEHTLEGDDVMVTGPLLLQNNKRILLDSISFTTTRHPRTALAVKGKKVLLITVDGRNDRAAGMSLYELSSLMKWLKADDAINLDGGGSTTLWVRGEGEGGIVNHPSDNVKMKTTAAYKPGTDLDNLAADAQNWDHGDERPVANVLLVRRRKGR